MNLPSRFRLTSSYDDTLNLFPKINQNSSGAMNFFLALHPCHVEDAIHASSSHYHPAFQWVLRVFFGHNA
jgi:hypothetical protein